ncbi:MAG: KH domain-containing protein [Anaerolineales bacterium]|nr:KH domain-containing protein [Anaerolineales bacterium]
MRELVDFIARSLVDDPTQVEVKEFRRGAQVILNLRVAKEDMGRIIGRGGRVASAIRTLLRVAAGQQGKRASLDIVEPE